MSKINRLMHFYNKNISYQRKNGIWRSRHVAILIACLIMLTPLKVIAAEENLNVNEFPQLQSETAVLMDEALTKEVTEIEERAKNRSGPDRVR